MIAIAKKSKKNRRLLAKKNIDKTVMAKIIKMSSIINYNNKYI